MIVIPEHRVYDLDDLIYSRVDIDVSEIDSIKIRHLDDYLIYFYKARNAVYQHLKLNADIIQLSTLHKYYGTSIGNWDSEQWRIDLLKDVDHPYTKTLKEIKYSDDYRHLSMSVFTALFFDHRRLLMYNERVKAIDATEYILQGFTKHWSCDSTQLANSTSRDFDYTDKRLKLISDFYDTILKDLIVPDNLKINYYYDRIEFITHDNYTIRFLLFKQGYVSIDVHDKSTLVEPVRASIVICKCSARYPIIAQVLERLEQNFDICSKYMSDLKALESEPAYMQMKIVLTAILTDLKENRNRSYFTSDKLKVVAVNPMSISRFLVSFTAYDKIRYKRSIVKLKFDGNVDAGTVDAGTVDYELTSHIGSKFNLSKISDIVDQLLRSGVINIYDEHDKIDLTDYIAYLTNKTKYSDFITFKMSLADRDKHYAKYFETVYPDIIKRYQSDLIEDKKSVDKQLKHVSDHWKFQPWMNYFEYNYRQKHLVEYRITENDIKAEQKLYAKTVIRKYILSNKTLSDILLKKKPIEFEIALS